MHTNTDDHAWVSGNSFADTMPDGLLAKSYRMMIDSTGCRALRRHESQELNSDVAAEWKEASAGMLSSYAEWRRATCSIAAATEN